MMSKAPSLASAPKAYDQEYFNQLLSQFRLYFATVDNPSSGVILTKAMANTNQTLTKVEASFYQIIQATGALTALRSIIVPLDEKQWTIYANVTGGFGVKVIGSTGTGVTVADGKRAIVYADGTNIVRVTPDT